MTRARSLPAGGQVPLHRWRRNRPRGPRVAHPTEKESAIESAQSPRGESRTITLADSSARARQGHTGYPGSGDTYVSGRRALVVGDAVSTAATFTDALGVADAVRALGKWLTPVYYRNTDERNNSHCCRIPSSSSGSLPVTENSVSLPRATSFGRIFKRQKF